MSRAKKSTATSTKGPEMAKAKPSTEKQVVFMVGNSRGAKNGDRRSVDPATAERLVRHGLARYPKSKTD